MNTILELLQTSKILFFFHNCLAQCMTKLSTIIPAHLNHQWDLRSKRSDLELTQMKSDDVLNTPY